MLSRLRVTAPARRERGFSLIELMVSIVVGLLVIAGATTLIVAINQSNATTIQSARLTQELRTTLEVIANDLRRARRMDDSIGQIGMVATMQAQTTPVTFTVPTDSITASSGKDCIKYAYQGIENNSANTMDTTRSGNNFRGIYRAVNGGVGSIALVTDSDAANVTCTATPTATLSSSQVDITALTFTPIAPSTNVNDGAIMITITGRPQFRAGLNYGYNGISRTLTQSVNVRSTKSGT